MMVKVLTTDEEIVKAEAEAWHKTHYRAEWFVGRTVGYAILLSALATYVFWDATRWTPSANSVWAGIIVWIILLAAGLMLYDFRTRRTYETATTVAMRAHKHLAFSLGTFAAGLLLAWVAHAAANAIAPAPTEAAEPPTITWNPNPDLSQQAPTVTVTKTTAKPPDKGDKPPAKTPAKPPAKTPATKPAAKPPAKTPAKTAPGKTAKPAAAKPPAKGKPPAKSAPQKAAGGAPKKARAGRQAARAKPKRTPTSPVRKPAKPAVIAKPKSRPKPKEAKPPAPKPRHPRSYKPEATSD